MWQFRCCSYISSDLGTNFTAQLTEEFEKQMECVPRFNSLCHPQSTRLAQRALRNVKDIVSKLAMHHPKEWHTYLAMVMWFLREVPNQTIGVAPWTLVMGHLPRGPLAVLNDSWCDPQLPISFGKNAQVYLMEFHNKLEIAKTYAPVESVVYDSSYFVNTCAIVCENDADFW